MMNDGIGLTFLALASHLYFYSYLYDPFLIPVPVHIPSPG